MRWKLSFAVPVLSLLFLATSCDAQTTRPETVPLTVTIPDSLERHPVTGVGFPSVSDTVYRPTDVRTQYLVGDVGPFVDGRYRIISHVHVGAGGKFFEDTVYVQKEATCDNSDETEGIIERIACSVVQRGVGLVCSATYSRMEKPPEICTGTIACRKCGEVRVCGAGSQCY